MSFFESLLLGHVKSEKDMLHALRDAAEGWYNELTKPFQLDLLDNVTGPLPGPDERKKLAKLAASLRSAEVLINDGDALANKMAEIEKSVGIPLFSTRKDLRTKAAAYLNSGNFLKKIGDKPFRASDTDLEYREAVREVQASWQQFRLAKDALVKQINSQLANIG